jgi:hypothetical protein
MTPPFALSNLEYMKQSAFLDLLGAYAYPCVFTVTLQKRPQEDRVALMEAFSEQNPASSPHGFFSLAFLKGWFNLVDIPPALLDNFSGHAESLSGKPGGRLPD